MISELRLGLKVAFCLCMQVKKGNLSETSPMLNDISGVLSWEKVNSGLLKMYKVGFLFPSCM